MLKEYKEVFVKGLDAEARDAITILNSGSYDEHLFCSGDKSAIKAIAVINKSFNIISLEKLIHHARFSIIFSRNTGPPKISITAFFCLIPIKNPELLFLASFSNF